jgi:hypothetical protein
MYCFRVSGPFFGLYLEVVDDSNIDGGRRALNGADRVARSPLLNKAFSAVARLAKARLRSESYRTSARASAQASETSCCAMSY